MKVSPIILTDRYDSSVDIMPTDESYNPLNSKSRDKVRLIYLSEAFNFVIVSAP